LIFGGSNSDRKLIIYSEIGLKVVIKAIRGFILFG
jgi:hypothetical protein